MFGRPVDVIFGERGHDGPEVCYFGPGPAVDLGAPYVEGAPELVVEVISECNRSRDSVAKFRAEERYGVREHGLVDPR